MYRHPQETKSASIDVDAKSIIFCNPNGYDTGNIIAKRKSLGLSRFQAIIGKHTFWGIVKYNKLVSGPEEHWYEGDMG